jgi:hypothetical protein
METTEMYEKSQPQIKQAVNEYSSGLPHSAAATPIGSKEVMWLLKFIRDATELLIAALNEQ